MRVGYALRMAFLLLYFGFLPFSISTTKVRNIFQICKDLGKYFSSISLIFSMNVSARFWGLTNLPLLAHKGRLSRDKTGLFHLKIQPQNLAATGRGAREYRK